MEHEITIQFGIIKGRIALADLLYSKVNELEDEGVNSNLPYAPIIDRIFNT
jgi:hypothetical protein